MSHAPDLLSPLVARAEGGDAAARGELFATPYIELHRLARREASRFGANGLLGATTLLHEAYLDIAQRDALAFPDRARFLAYAARALRGLVIDRVRARTQCAKTRRRARHHLARHGNCGAASAAGGAHQRQRRARRTGLARA